MIVCGDDALAHRLAGELRDVYRERVTVVVPAGAEQPLAPEPMTSAARAAALLGRFSAAVGRTAEDGAADSLRLLHRDTLDAVTLVEAGVERAAALALVHDDDETNIRAALAARRLNPRLRLVIRLYNRKLGRYLADLLDEAADTPGTADTTGPRGLDASTTVLSDADTAAPALAATAVADTSKVVQADGLLLRAVERTPRRPGEVADPGMCTLALLSSTTSDPAGAEGSERSGDQAPQLLPDDRAVAAAAGRGTVVLEAVSHPGPDLPRRAHRGRGAPLAALFSRRLRLSLAGLGAVVVALAVAQWLSGGDSALHAGYLTVLDLFAINDPATDGDAPRQVIQLLAGIAGLAMLPLLIAAALEALGSYRTASTVRRPPRGLSGHVVLLGLGKIGTRVLARLRELGIPVVCVEVDPEARGVALARSLRVPTVLGDVTEEGVLEAAKIHRAYALLALSSDDTTNLEAALYARSVEPGLRVTLRLYDDDFATAVYRTLRAAHPEALTRSRSVTSLAAPAFAVAMMGRQILGAIPVERRVLVFAALEVAGLAPLEGRTVAEAFRAGAWRILALDTADPADRRPDLTAHQVDDEGHESGLVWGPHPGYVLKPQDRVVLAATRHGLAELLGRRPPSRPVPRPEGRPSGAAPTP